MRSLLTAFVLTVMAIGLVVTALWLRYAGMPAFAELSAASVATLAGVAILSTVNLSIRWVRWHFLTRRFVRNVPARTSLMLYFGTLPAFATPLYLGEFIRTALVARRVPEARPAVFAVWAVERLADATALLVFLMLARGHAFGLAALATGVGALWLAGRRARGRTLRALLEPRSLAMLAATSLVAWAMPALALWGVVAQLGPSIPLAGAAQVFSLGTLLGGVALLPLGTGVAGSSMIVQLDSLGVASQVSVVAVAIFRLGTTWFALGLGLLAFLRWRRPILSVARQPVAQEHFDELAAEYGDQIPAAVRDRLVSRKIDIMGGWLRRSGVAPGAQGLDLGCGQGWYAVEMARLGYAMSACDRAAAQVDQARRFIAAEGQTIETTSADARSLPYSDASFDFAYGVNVMHHVIDPGGTSRALAEVVRVLRPGGSFFLQEINTENPLFAFYMGYVFPLIREIDDGTEAWVKPTSLPPVAGARWDPDHAYLTFLPDFTPAPLVRLFGPLERALERSPLRAWSAHFVARLVKEGGSRS